MDLGSAVHLLRHCEERSDEAIQSLLSGFLDCFAEPVLGQREALIRVLAMTVNPSYSALRANRAGVDYFGAIAIRPFMFG